MPETNEDQNARVIETKLRQDGAGLSVYFPKDAVEEWGLEEGQAVSVVRELENDTYSFRLEGAADGFTREELNEYADQNDWVSAHSWSGNDDWSETYYTNNESIRISIMNPTLIDGHPLNNVDVETQFGVLSSLDEYRQLLEWVEPYPHITIGIKDSENVWVKYAESVRTDDDIDLHAPDPESLSVVYEKVDKVGVRLKYLNASVDMTLDDLQRAVNTLSAATEQFDLLPTERKNPE